MYFRCTLSVSSACLWTSCTQYIYLLWSTKVNLFIDFACYFYNQYMLCDKLIISSQRQQMSYCTCSSLVTSIVHNIQLMQMQSPLDHMLYFRYIIKFFTYYQCHSTHCYTTYIIPSLSLRSREIRIPRVSTLAV